MDHYLSEQDTLNIIREIKSSSLNFAYHRTKHRLVIMDEYNNEKVFIRLPISLLDIDHTDEPVTYLVLLIQSGSCAMGCFEDDLTIDHKVFKAYMVRKKQGKSQVKYLKSKGKSRAGSRVRLANTVQFFEDINERLQEYFEEHEIQRIAFSCSKTLLPFLFQSKIPPPFDKKDERLFKIPKHIHTPGYDVLMHTQTLLLKGELIFKEEYAPFTTLLQTLS